MTLYSNKLANFFANSIIIYISLINGVNLVEHDFLNFIYFWDSLINVASSCVGKAFNGNRPLDGCRRLVFYLLQMAFRCKCGQTITTPHTFLRKQTRGVTKTLLVFSEVSRLEFWMNQCPTYIHRHHTGTEVKKMSLALGRTFHLIKIRSI